MFMFLKQGNRQNDYGPFYDQKEMELNGFFGFLVGIIAGVVAYALILAF